MFRTKKLLVSTHRKLSTMKNPKLQLKNQEKAILMDDFGRNHTYLRISLTERCNLRYFSNSLSHVESRSGQARMVNVSEKAVSERTARARALITVGSEIVQLIEENCVKKGDVLSVCKLAGILAAKKTADLIPLCHNIVLNQVAVEAKVLNEDTIVVESIVRCEGRTGVEMEALMAVSVAALTVYDMCKSINKGIVINDVKLLSKTGGKSGDFHCDDVKVKNYDRSPIQHSDLSIFVGSV